VTFDTKVKGLPWWITVKAALGGKRFSELYKKNTDKAPKQPGSDTWNNNWYGSLDCGGSFRKVGHSREMFKWNIQRIYGWEKGTAEERE
jgi:hypothetical protein